MCVSSGERSPAAARAQPRQAAAGALEDLWFPKGRRDARRRLARIRAALLSKLLMRLVPGGPPPAGEQQLRRPVRYGHPPDQSPARSAGSFPRPDRRGVPASGPGPAGPARTAVLTR